jgi:hypothetical protein
MLLLTSASLRLSLLAPKLPLVPPRSLSIGHWSPRGCSRGCSVGARAGARVLRGCCVAKQDGLANRRRETRSSGRCSATPHRATLLRSLHQSLSLAQARGVPPPPPRPSLCCHTCHTAPATRATPDLADSSLGEGDLVSRSSFKVCQSVRCVLQAPVINRL